MTTPTSAVRDRSISVTKSGNAYTVADVPAAETLIEIEAIAAGTALIQFPNGLAYANGETALLTVAQVDELSASGEGVTWQNNGIAQPIRPEGSPLSASVAGADVDNAILNAATNQYTATFTFANGDTAAFDETNSVAAGVVWAVVPLTGTPPVATIAATGLLTAHATNDGTVQVTATLQGVSAISPILTVA